MTDEQINAAIAEACGWKGNLICRDMEGNLWPIEPPNYCDDLNAMYEAENTILGTDLFYHYCLHISGPLLRANARQRAEAFLRTLGKWDQSGDATEMEAQK